MNKNLFSTLIQMSKYIFYLSILQITFASFALSNDVRGQDIENVMVSGHWKNTKLTEVLEDLQHETDFFFSYSYDAVDNIRLSSDSQHYNLKSLMAFISAETGLSFKINDKIVYVYNLNIENSDSKKVYIPQSIDFLVSNLEYDVIINPTFTIDDRPIKGMVTDRNGEPLIGATVQVKGCNIGTVTDVDGSFSLNLTEEEGAILIVSYIGYISKEVEVNGNDYITIALSENMTELDEVVVIGYGTDTKEKFNGAVSKVDNERINNYSVANLDQSLMGTLAGVQIAGNNKNPGENSVIQIRGVSTLTAGSNPLIVVDGNPLTEGSSLSSINTQDIESINILKDAASAAIYGSRASNGVILITTKKGQEGKLKVTYDTYFGAQSRIDKFKLVDAYDAAKFDYDARNYGYLSGGEGRFITDDNATRDAKGGGKRSRIQPFLQDYLDGKEGLTNTDWADEVFRTATQQNHYLNLSGGSKKTNYSVSFGYFQADNIVIDSDYERYTTNFKLNSDINDYIRFGVSTNLSLADASPVGYRAWSDFNLGALPDPAQGIFLMFPYYDVYDENGNVAPATQLEDNNANWDGPISGNAVATMTMTERSQNDFRVFGNTFLEIEPIQNLKFRSSLGGDFGSGVQEFFAPTTLGNYRTPVANSNTMAFKVDDNRENYLSENIITYDKSSGNSNWDFLIGYSYQQEKRNRVRLESEDFVDDNIRNISGATTITASNSSSKWALESYFSRVQYDFANKYSFSASLRRDGSSRFGANTKYGNFASLSAGWTLSNEAFFPQNDNVSFAKLRASWGQTGNNQIGDFAAIALVNDDNYVHDGTLEAGSYTSTSPNADLSWETNNAMNFGLDLGFLQNKLFLTAEYYISNTTDLLLSVPVPQQSGFSSSLQNIGELENRGFELELRGTGYRLGDVNLTFNANWSMNRNKVIALGEGQDQIIQNNGIAFITEVGQPIAQMYVYDILDVYRSQEQIESDPITPLPGTEVGDYVVRDANGDGMITADDRTPSGDYNPDFVYGFGFTADYKGFDVAVQFNGVEGRKAVDRMTWYTESGEGFFVPSQYYFDNYFNDDNPDGFFRRPDFSSFSSAGRLTRNSTLNIMDADYFRLRSLQVGYTLPSNVTDRVGINRLRVYVTGNNIFNITNFRGYNPDGIDNSSNSGQTLTRGWIQSTNPLTRFLAVGANVQF